MPAVNPYLTFNGDCEEAFQFYQSVFGGELMEASRYSMWPDHDPADADRVLHVTLMLGDGQAVMGSDRQSADDQPVSANSIATSIAPDSEEQAEQIFRSLAEGGRVTMPYEKQFWGDFFGSCTDRYGHNWQVNYHPGD